jgi:hypothetical protein
MLIEILAAAAVVAGVGDAPQFPDGADRGNGRGIVVYRDDGFRGSSLTFNSAVPDLANSGMNDQISSMRMRGRWTACTDAYFRGHCETFSGDVSSLRAAGMNDRISSLRPGRYDGPGGRPDRPDRPGRPGGGWDNDRDEITVYRDALYRGPTTTFRGEMPNLRNTGFNDMISSMRFRGAWEVCTDAYFRGNCRTFDEDVWNLDQHGMNDRVSSLRPVRRGGRW